MAQPPKKDDVNASLDAETLGDGSGEDGAAGDSGKKKKMIIIIAAAVLILLIAVGAGLYFTGALDKFLKKGRPRKKHTPKARPRKAKSKWNV
jgi:flagellar basal body-associated protein FliL